MTRIVDWWKSCSYAFVYELITFLYLNLIVTRDLSREQLPFARVGRY